MEKWKACNNILCIRADNMGDLLMSSPSIRALKESFGSHITMLTSSLGSKITPLIPEINETIVSDLPWIKTENMMDGTAFLSLIQKIASCRFDAAVIFTVYSQSPLPAAMMAYMAHIPKRLAYCRENPYHLLTDWVIEQEPYNFIQHQVQRDLNLVKMIGAESKNDRIKILISEQAKISALQKLSLNGVDLNKKWLILHPGVSEAKREYPAEYWIETGSKLRDQLSFQLILTGSSKEKELTQKIQQAIGKGSYCLAGALTIEEFAALIQESCLVISVNTGTVHIAAATQTPIIVLYALTNPQHTPWQVPSCVLPYSVMDGLKSKNEIVNYVSRKLMNKIMAVPLPAKIVEAAIKLLDQQWHPESTGILSIS